MSQSDDIDAALIAVLVKVFEKGVVHFLKNASNDDYGLLNALVRANYPEANTRVQLFNIRQRFFGPHLGAFGMGPDGSRGGGYVLLNVDIPDNATGFVKTFVIGVLVDGNENTRTVARISFDKNSYNMTEIPYQEVMAYNLPAEFFTG